MRYTDLTKSQNKKILSLLEREDKRAGSPSNKPVVQGSASAGISAAAPETAKPSVTAKGIVSGSVGAGLPKAQQIEAALVGKLPGDFPIEQWESMNTKAQLKAMQHSGLTDQEQWVLLNATAPLSVLDDFARFFRDSTRATNPNMPLGTERFPGLRDSGSNSFATDSSLKLPSLQGRNSIEELKNEMLALKLSDRLKKAGLFGSTASPAETPLPKPGPSPDPTASPTSKPLKSNAGNSKARYNWFSTYEDAVNAWAKSFWRLSKDLEHCALIYKTVDADGNELFTFGETKLGDKGNPKLGIQPNVAASFLSLYFHEKISDASLVGFVHTHPAPPTGYTYESFSDIDLLLKKLPGIDFVTLVPYEKENADPTTK